MPVPVTCSGCGAKMNAPDTFIGKRVACPRCKTSFTIPDPNASDGFEVVEEEEALPVAEVVDDDPPPAPKPAVAKPASQPGIALPAVAKPASQPGIALPAVAKPASSANVPAVAKASTPGGKVKKPNARRKKQVDTTDYLTRVNGKPIAVRPGEAPPPPMPRKSKPRD